MATSFFFSSSPAEVTRDGNGPVAYLKSSPEEDALLLDLTHINADKDGGANRSAQRQHSLPQRAEGQEKALHRTYKDPRPDIVG